MRGSHANFANNYTFHRIIPAYAGLTSLLIGRKVAERDHPRVCGAHNVFSVGTIDEMGSSPRMRGSRAVFALSSHNLGIIPAYAGLTHIAADARHRSRDHPRVCGAHTMAVGLSAAATGSSPRMRGSPSSVSAARICIRIIPAYAGLTLAG